MSICIAHSSNAQYREKKNALSKRPQEKGEVLWATSRNCICGEFHILGPAVEDARRPVR